MTLKTLILTLLLIFSTQYLYAKEKKSDSILLQANEETSFMNYEFHNLAYEAASNKNYEDAYRIYLKLADKGDNRAEYNIGMLYMHGLGVEKKKMEAYKWLRRASKHGNKEATLYFKEMNERYAKKHQSETAKKTEVKKESVQKAEAAAVSEKKTPVETAKSVAPAAKTEPVQNAEAEEESESLLYMMIAGVVFLLALGVFFLKKSSGSDKRESKTAQSTPKYKSQMYDITYAHIMDYHTELLKQVDLAKLKADKYKMQIYYMFLYGMIDYFCQLEKFTDSEQRRIFSTHMAKQEGQEKLTAIMQSILEGQRDHSMYHYQAAGGVSAKTWHREKSKEALSMFKKLLTEKNA